jgi:hypothetical protein
VGPEHRSGVRRLEAALAEAVSFADEQGTHDLDELESRIDPITRRSLQVCSCDHCFSDLEERFEIDLRSVYGDGSRRAFAQAYYLSVYGCAAFRAHELDGLVFSEGGLVTQGNLMLERSERQAKKIPAEARFFFNCALGWNRTNIAGSANLRPIH